MTLLLAESFDDGLFDATNNLSPKWAAAVLGAAGDLSTSYGRNGKGVRLNGSTGYLLRYGLGSNKHATVIMAFAMRMAAISTNVGNLVLFKGDGGTTTHITVQIDSSGFMKAYRGGSTLLGTASVALVANTWAYVEIKVTLSDTVGVVSIRINGTSVLNLTNQDTKNAGTDTVLDEVSFVGVSSGTIPQLDDIVILNGAGSVNNDFIGDVTIESKLPNGNGNYSQLTGSDGNSTDNYLLVNEATPDTTSYVEHATNANKDTYTFADLAGTGVPLAVIARSTVRKDTTAAKSIRNVARISGTDYFGSDFTLGYGSDSMAATLWEMSPATAAAWTATEFNAAEFGVEVRA